MQDPLDFLFDESVQAKSQILLNYSSVTLSGFQVMPPELQQKTLIFKIQLFKHKDYERLLSTKKNQNNKTQKNPNM